MSDCGKKQLSRCFRSSLRFCGVVVEAGGLAMTMMSYLIPNCIELSLVTQHGGGWGTLVPPWVPAPHQAIGPLHIKKISARFVSISLLIVKTFYIFWTEIRMK